MMRVILDLAISLGRNALERKVEHSSSYGVLQLQFGINKVSAVTISKLEARVGLSLCAGPAAVASVF